MASGLGRKEPESHGLTDEVAAMSTVILRRDVLPETRRSLTHKFLIGTHEGYLTVGLFTDGRPGEIFIKMSKEGSTLSGLLQGFCRAFSLALQHGLSVRDAAERFRGMRFEPSGPTNNPRIPETSSILDYVARYLQLNFVPEEQGFADAQSFDASRAIRCARDTASGAD